MNRTRPLLAPLARSLARARGLRERIALALGASVLVSSVVLSLGLAAYAQAAFADGAQRELDALARQTARELSYGMERFVREIELQAKNPVLTESPADTGAMRQVLEAIQRAHPEFAHLSVLDVRSAKVLAATGGIFEGGDATGRPVFVEGQKRLFVADVHDAAKLADLLPKPANGEPLRFLDAAAPIAGADGRTVRVLGSHLSWEWSDSIRKRVLQPIEASRGVELMLVDTAGKLVLTPSGSAKLGDAFNSLAPHAAKGGVSTWSNGQAYLSAEAATFASGSFPGLGWRVVARQPVAVIFDPAERLRNLFLGGGLILGFLAAGLGWVLAGRLAKPIADLARAATSAAPGDFLARSGGNEVTEVAAVRKAFDRVTGESLARAERLLSELNAVYQGAPVALCILDSGLRYVRVNQVWSDAFGLGESRGITESLLATDAPDPLISAAKRALADQAPVCLDIETSSPSGTRGWQTVLTPLGHEGGVTSGLSVVATDITEIRLAERELREADSRKNQFLSMLAHELRNPLAPLSNALAVLERTPEPEQAARMRKMMRGQLRRMSRLIDDLLEVSRITNGKVSMRMEPLSIVEVCEAAADSVRPAMEERRQTFNLQVEPDLPPVLGDRVRLEQVVCNLLANASKYGVDGGRVFLRAESDGRQLQVIVEDDGQGIAPDFLPRVFELFAQEHSSIDRPDCGLGVGLTLVQNLVELHSGKVTAESSGVGKGARFTIVLPFYAQRPLHTAAANDRGTGSEPQSFDAKNLGAR